MTRQSRTALRARTGHGAQGRIESRVRGIVRRLRVVTSSGFAWALDGFSDSYGKTETADVENFEGVGFASRPKATDNAEAITVKVGGKSGHQVIVATRNRDAFKVLDDAEGLAADEVVIYSGGSMVKIKADGKIEIGAIGGTRAALATKADIDELKAIFVAWTPIANDGGAALKTAITAASPAGWNPVGTTKLEAE